MVDVVRHPSAPPAASAAAPAPSEPEWIGDPELESQTRELIAMLKYEIGLRWMSFDLRLQIERIELLTGERGTAPSVAPDAQFSAREPKVEPMVYEVTLNAPAINEVVVTAADSEEQAKERAVGSAMQRMLKAGNATVRELPPNTPLPAA